MTPGVLTLCGTLFMRGSVYEARTSAGEVQFTFPLLSREGRDQQRYLAVWEGAPARSFVEAHRAQLRPGCAITVTMHKPRTVSNQIVAEIYSASLAPDRWQHLHEARAGAEEAAA